MRTEDLLFMLNCRMQASPNQLARYREGRPFIGPVAVGMVFEWEPDRPVAAETCEVVEIKGEGDDRMIGTRGNRHTDKVYWNDESRFREAAVPSLLRHLPTGY